jgi:glycosyltransferase involved in cell wall biosynthesis
VLQEVVAARAAANPRIHYVGFVRGKEIPAYTCAGDVVYYGFDPANPNARFSAPNKLYEALAAGRPLITGDFGEIADVVRQAGCGIVLPEYSSAAVKEALETLSDAFLRESMAEKARRFGATFMHWEKGEEILHRKYGSLVPCAPPLKREREMQVAPKPETR